MTATIKRRETHGIDAALARIDQVHREDAMHAAEALAELEAEAGADRGHKLEQFEARRVPVVTDTGESRTRILPPAGYGEAWSGGGVA